MLAYTSRTGTKTTIAALREAQWRLLISSTEQRSPPPGFRYAIDNGAWSAYTQGTDWNEESFLRLLERIGDGADFVVAPDIVTGGLKSLELTRAWLPRLERCRLVLVPLQNGIEPQHVAPLVNDRVGLFVGGDDEYKLGTLGRWGTFARKVGCYLHVGRVNTQKRIWLCAQAGANSFDGTSPVLFPKNLERLERARRQMNFVFDTV